MTHREHLQTDLKAYSDHELPWLRRAAVRRHLAHCADCQKEIAEMTQIAEDLRATEPEDTLAPTLRTRILDAAQQTIPGDYFSSLPVLDKIGLRRRQNRLLRACFGASLTINLLFVVIVGRSDLFQSAVSLTDLHPRKIKMVKPIPVKPQPKPKEVKPPPPPPKQPQPHITPLLHLHPTPPRPEPVISHVAVIQSVNSPSPIAVERGRVSPLPEKPFIPGVQPLVPPAKSTDDQTTQIVPAPPSPPPPVAPPVPPPPPPPVQTTGYSDVSYRDAAPVGDYAQPDLSGVDVTSLASPSVTIAFEIGETGQVQKARVKKSCGDPSVDEKCKEAIQNTRFLPAIQDHYPQVSQQEYTFNISN